MANPSALGTVLPKGFTPGPQNRDEGRVVACVVGAGGTRGAAECQASHVQGAPPSPTFLSVNTPRERDFCPSSFGI